MQRRSKCPGYTNDLRTEQVFEENKKLDFYAIGDICHFCWDKWKELQDCSCKVPWNVVG